MEETAEQLAAREAAELAERKAAEALEAEKRISKAKEVCEKDPVNVASGAMTCTAVDVVLPGPVPLVWARTWYSTSDWRGPLGHC